jgi:hypothetical protein
MYCMALKVYTCQEVASGPKTFLNIFCKLLQQNEPSPAWQWSWFQYQLTLMTNTVFSMFQTLYILDFLSASRSSGTLRFSKHWDFQSKDVASGFSRSLGSISYQKYLQKSLIISLKLKLKENDFILTWSQSEKTEFPEITKMHPERKRLKKSACLS